MSSSPDYLGHCSTESIALLCHNVKCKCKFFCAVLTTQATWGFFLLRLNYVCWKCHNCFMSPILVVEEQNGDDFLPSENSFANNERVLSSRRLWFILWSVWFWKKAICLIIFCNKMISKSISITLFDYYTIWIELHFCQPFIHKSNKCK